MDSLGAFTSARKIRWPSSRTRPSAKKSSTGRAVHLRRNRCTLGSPGRLMITVARRSTPRREGQLIAGQVDNVGAIPIAPTNPTDVTDVMTWERDDEMQPVVRGHTADADTPAAQNFLPIARWLSAIATAAAMLETSPLFASISASAVAR